MEKIKRVSFQGEEIIKQRIEDLTERKVFLQEEIRDFTNELYSTSIIDDRVARTMLGSSIENNRKELNMVLEALGTNKRINQYTSSGDIVLQNGQMNIWKFL